jgi:hypothetical protein
MSHARHRPPATALLAALLLVSSATGCTTGPSEEASPPSPPQAWFVAYGDAIRQGLFNAGRFYAEDATLDPAALGMQRVQGRTEVLEAIGSRFTVLSREHDPAAGRHLYLSTRGVLLEDPALRSEFDWPHEVLTINRMGATGIQTQTFAVSELGWRAARPDDARILAAHVLAQDWAAAWADPDPARVAALYADGARIADDLAGVRLDVTDGTAGPSARELTPAALPGFTIDQLADLGGPAVYVVGGRGRRARDPFTSIVVMGRSDTGQGCPGRLAAVLRLDPDGRLVRAEERYHHVADLLRCSAGRLRIGWWDRVSVPSAVAMEPTGTLNLAEHEVALFNAEPGLDGLITWAHGRFAEAGLAPPVLTRVAFFEPSMDLCEGIGGLAAGSEISLCFRQDGACVDESCTRWRRQARWYALHELGHLWMHADLTPEVTRAFTEQAGLPTWSDADQPWDQRGVELAASVLAWGLLGEPSTVDDGFGVTSCEELAALYTTLTGQPVPDGPDCPTAPAP